MPGFQFDRDISEDLDLLRGIREGNKVALETLFRLYFGRLCTFVNGYVKSRDLSKDIVQALFVKIWEKRQDLFVQSSTRAYLYRSARNLSLDYLKHQRIKFEWEEQAVSEHASPEDPEASVAREELLNVLQQSIEGLPGRCRTIFELHWSEGLTYQEIAEALNLSIKTVETQMGRALKRLRKQLHPYLPVVLVVTAGIRLLG